MYKIENMFKKEELIILEMLAGQEYELIYEIKNECYMPIKTGKYFYSDLFPKIDIEYFEKQKYDKVTPCKLIKFYGFYFFEVEEDKGKWWKTWL